MTSYNSEFATMLQNSSINITLNGWPAAVSILAVCAASVGIFALSNKGSTSGKSNLPFHKIQAA